MGRQPFWTISLFLLVLGAFGIGILLWLEARHERTPRTEERILFCPLRRRYVRAALVKDPGSLKILGVSRCTGSPDPEKVTCGKPCIARGRVRPIRTA